MIQEMILPDGKRIYPVHFLARKGDPGGIYVLVLACQPTLRNFTAGPRTPLYKRTEETGAVSCPFCRMTEEFQRAREANR